jgi:hypothetical protein
VHTMSVRAHKRSIADPMFSLPNPTVLLPSCFFNPDRRGTKWRNPEKRPPQVYKRVT